MKQGRYHEPPPKPDPIEHEQARSPAQNRLETSRRFTASGAATRQHFKLVMWKVAQKVSHNEARLDVEVSGRNIPRTCT